MSIGVIVPTRGRPTSLRRLHKSFVQTAKRPDSSLITVLDINDHSFNEYPSVGTERFGFMVSDGNMVQRSNWAASAVLSDYDIIGWAADDNLFKTPGWDVEVNGTFANSKVGMVNTNDLLVGNEKGGAFFIRSTVVRQLGYLLLPVCEHLYVDFAATELFKHAGAYVYRSDIIVEHLHPYAGKAEWDHGYREVNNALQDDRDRTAFYRWREGNEFAEDIEKVKACLGL